MSDRCSPLPSGGHPAFTDRPTVPELKELLSELVDWRRFGAHLPGMTKQKIVRLGKFGNQSVGSRKEALFTRWLREYEKASWNDVITALYKSKEFKLHSSVADDIKRRYTSTKHGQTTSESSQATNSKEQTTSKADDVPNDDELRKDAKRAITRNIDKLTDVISSVNTFRDTVLGFAAKELIPTSFKNSLFDFSTTKDRQMKTIELLNHLENFISFNPTYLDVFLTVLAEKSGKTGKEVASDIAKEYGHKLPQFTTSMTDDVPSDELMKDAKRAITRNIDQLTNFLSSSEIIFDDIRLGFITNELIPTSFKDNLLSTSTTLDTRAKAVELVRHIEDMVSTNPKYLDVFLTILNTKCGGRVGGEIIRNIAKEYGHKLPRYDDMIAAKPVIGAVGGAVSSDDTANRSEIILISESQVKEDIKRLYRSFGSLVKSIRCSLIVSGNSVGDIAIYIKAIIGPLDLTQGITIDELFDKIQPHYSFLDCELLEDIVNEFLSAKTELQIELIQYNNKVIEFKTSACLRYIKTAIEESLISKQDVTDTTCRVVIKLHEIWGRITLKHFHDVLKYLFLTRKNILAHIHIEGGSIIISFIAPLSQSQYLIDNVLSKKNFLQRTGIIEVSINDQSILPDRVDINLNQSLLEASEEGNRLGVSILLQLGASINYRNGEGKTSLMLACSGGHEHVVQTLLSANADVNSQDWLGYTALMRAVESHSIRIVSSLLKRNADPNKIATHMYISTALIMACTSCQTDVVKLLLSYNADPSIQSYGAVLMSTKTDDHLNILSQLLSLPLVSEYIYVILMRAVKYGQPQIVATLLKHVDPNITNEQLHLSVSCCKGDYRTVMQLLHHPNVNLAYPRLPPLILASSCGHLPIVELLLKQRIPVDIKSIGDYTSLMYASANGHLRIVELLLKRQANVNIQNRSENTALILASQNGHHQVVELLHKNVNSCASCSTALILACSSGYHQVVKVLIKEHNNFFVNIQDTNGFTALMGASENGHHQVVELLLNHHADVNILNSNSCTALIYASQFGHHQVVKLLLKKHAYVNIRKRNGSSTALFLASYKGHHQVVKLLLKEHADVNISADAGVTALMVASRNGHHQVVEWLLNKHADVNIRTDSGFTALLFASENGHHQVVELLLKEHADVNICDIDGRTALIIASQNGHHQVVEQLLNKHADVNIRDNKYGCTALILASRNGYHQVVELLLNKHANVNIHAAHDGFTALMIASRYGHHQVVNLLLQKCADVNNRSNDGYTALILASEYGHDKIVELLLKEHADVTVFDNDDCTALFVACLHNHQEVVKLLLKKPINDSDKWLSFMIAKYYDHNEIVEILHDEIVTPQTDSSNSTGFKPVHDELISKLEDQDDYTIQPATTQSFLDPLMLNQKEIWLKDLTARKIKLTSFALPIDVEFLMRHQPKGKPSPVLPLPLTTLPLEHSRVM